MDSGVSRKRPWEEDRYSEPPLRDEGSTHVGHSSQSHSLSCQWSNRTLGDRQNQARRTLPPLATNPYSPRSNTVLAVSPAASPPPQEALAWHVSRPRSLSVVHDVAPLLKRLGQEDDSERTTALSAIPDHQRDIPPNSSASSQNASGRAQGIPAAGLVACCSFDCGGQTCAVIRDLTLALASELILLETRSRPASHSTNRLRDEIPDFKNMSLEMSLQWALSLVKRSNNGLRDDVIRSRSISPVNRHSQFDNSPSIEQGHHHADYKGRPDSTSSLHGQFYEHGKSAFGQPTHSFTAMRQPRQGDFSKAESPRHSSAATGHGLPPHISPLQISQPARTAMLPSPSSMNFSSASVLPPFSPPPPLLDNTAQAAHLQDLQHQVSVKTLALQTMQREYDSLLQKLERQRTKCATLEKKFEVSDVEINSLTDEKERLQGQLAALENQVEDTQKARDEARNQLAKQGAQYMQIVDMANRLQAQGAKDKKLLDAEKLELVQRITSLEQAMMTAQSGAHEAPAGESAVSLASEVHARHPSLASLSSETVVVPRSQLARLNTRTQSLEAALKALKDECIAMQAATSQVANISEKIQAAVKQHQ